MKSTETVTWRPDNILNNVSVFVPQLSTYVEVRNGGPFAIEFFEALYKS